MPRPCPLESNREDQPVGDGWNPTHRDIRGGVFLGLSHSHQGYHRKSIDIGTSKDHAHHMLGSSGLSCHGTACSGMIYS